ncbi:uncharacterized protein PV09_05790 [Verruconis gallopava]|uniref:Uncharacterized protein n=1 Tax=Verruconis gallopava TaxID=253628 RepID=A0A0D1YRC6_9PEZI|nr:uncharacterized protein PV09_05790 [Verruconis gallopava]KIW03147.1 hypothetical protein PV09_05790 [Verruconis gallopava]
MTETLSTACFPDLPCKLHSNGVLDKNFLMEHGVRIFTAKDDLIPSRNTLKKHVGDDTQRPETAVGIVCEMCFKKGRVVYMEALKTVARGDFLGYRAQLPGRNREWVKMGDEKISFHGCLEYSTVGFQNTHNVMLSTLRFILVHDHSTMARLLLNPKAILTRNGRLLVDEDPFKFSSFDGFLSKRVDVSSHASQAAQVTPNQPSQNAPTAQMLTSPTHGQYNPIAQMISASPETLLNVNSYPQPCPFLPEVESDTSSRGSNVSTEQSTQGDGQRTDDHILITEDSRTTGTTMSPEKVASCQSDMSLRHIDEEIEEERIAIAQLERAIKELEQKLKERDAVRKKKAELETRLSNLKKAAGIL